MIKRLALLTLLATPFLGHAQAPEDETVGVKAPAIPLVTYERMTAPGASFLLEISFPQVVPAITYMTFFMQTAPVSGNYSFEGHTYRMTSGFYSVANHGNNARDLNFSTPMGTLAFYSGGFRIPRVPSIPFVGFPVQANRVEPTPQNPNPAGSATFLPVDSSDAGTVGMWHFTFTNVRGQSITGCYANVFGVTGRLVMPPPHPLTTR